MPWGSTKEVSVGRQKGLRVFLGQWGGGQALLTVLNLVEGSAELSQKCIVTQEAWRHGGEPGGVSSGLKFLS